MLSRWISMALAILIVAAAGTLIWDFGLDAEHDTILGLTAFGVGVITFFGTIRASNVSPNSKLLAKGSIRAAIAASIVITYLFILGMVVFLKTPEKLSPITESFVTNFTSIVGVTIAFYFGASAVVQALGKEETTNEEEMPKKE